MSGVPLGMPCGTPSKATNVLKADAVEGSQAAEAALPKLSGALKDFCFDFAFD